MSDYRETLERLMHYLERKSAMKDAAAIREALDEVERLKSENASFLQSYDNLDHRHNEQAAEVERLKAALSDPASHYCKELREENERLKAALEGKPVIKSEWEALLEENERLKADVLYEQERNANNVRAYSEQLEQRTAEVERLKDPCVAAGYHVCGRE